MGSPTPTLVLPRVATHDERLVAAHDASVVRLSSLLSLFFVPTVEGFAAMPYMPYLCRICAVSVPYLPIIHSAYLIWIVGTAWSIETIPIILMVPDHPDAAHAVDAVWPGLRHRNTANTASD